MSRLVKQLGLLVDKPVPVLRGKVVKSTTNSIFVSSSIGVKEYQVANASSFNAGDPVKVQGGTYLGRLPSDMESKVIVV